ncbi:MAG: hypothetical protein Q9191_001928 [Dirinaria sp. TL-2023a]
MEEKGSYRYEHGRRYHAFDEGAYYMPNDESELSRLDSQHQIWRLTLDNALFHAPIAENPQLVLDVGTGSGVWAIDFATQYPNCHVLGIDLSPTNLGVESLQNCTFQIHNVESDWHFGKDSSFDLIHSRMLVQGLHDWHKYFRRCYDYLKPGGWVEAHEVQYPMSSANPSVSSDAPFLRWSHLIHEGLAKGEVDGGAANSFSNYLHQVGFKNVTEERVPWAVGPWMEEEKGKMIGAMEQANLQDGLEGMTVGVFTKNLGWTSQQAKDLVAEVKRDISDPDKKYIVHM